VAKSSSNYNRFKPIHPGNNTLKLHNKLHPKLNEDLHGCQELSTDNVAFLEQMLARVVSHSLVHANKVNVMLRDSICLEVVAGISSTTSLTLKAPLQVPLMMSRQHHSSQVKILMMASV
jgi:hypothetical protein